MLVSIYSQWLYPWTKTHPVGHLLSLGEQPMLQFMQWHRELGLYSLVGSPDVNMY